MRCAKFNVHISTEGVKKWAPGLVKFVPAFAYHFCLNLPEVLSQPWDHFFARPYATVACNFWFCATIWDMLPSSYIVKALAFSALMPASSKFIPSVLPRAPDVPAHNPNPRRRQGEPDDRLRRPLGRWQGRRHHHRPDQGPGPSLHHCQGAD